MHMQAHNIQDEVAELTGTNVDGPSAQANDDDDDEDDFGKKREKEMLTDIDSQVERLMTKAV